MNTKTFGYVKVVVDFITTFITTLIVGVAIALVLVRLLGWNLFSVDSHSMTPQYSVDTLVVVQDVEPEKVEEGDVISFVMNEEGMIVTHRVVDIDSAGKTFTTKGDANTIVDPSPVMWENMIGKVVMGIPKIGKPLRYATAKENRPIVIGLIVIVLLSSFIWDIISARITKKHPKDDDLSDDDSKQISETVEEHLE